MESPDNDDERAVADELVGVAILMAVVILAAGATGSSPCAFALNPKNTPHFGSLNSEPRNPEPNTEHEPGSGNAEV